MIYNLTALKDTTIFSNYPINNTGHDTALVLLNKDKDIYSRILIKFNHQSIVNVLPQNANAQYFLKLFLAQSFNITSNHKISIYPLMEQ